LKENMLIVYVIRNMLQTVKKEMDEKGLTFDEILEYYDETVKLLEDADI